MTPGRSIDYATIAGGLRENGLLPGSCRSVFVSGSLVRGWGNATSDLDAIVVSDEPWRSASAESSHVALVPDTLQHESTFLGGIRCDIEYWLDSQVDQLMEKVSIARFESGEPTWQTLSPDEVAMLERMPYAIASGEGGWLERRQAQLRSSAHRAVLVSQSLDHCGSYVEDVAGQCEAGDIDSAVLTARLAFGHAVDGLLAGAGQFGSRWPKWRARRFREANPSILSFDEYWAIETMQTFDPSQPRKWIDEVIRLCRNISMEVEV